MNPSDQTIKALFAELYYEAALGDIPMERLVAIAEPIKHGLLEEQELFSVLLQLDQRLGFALEEQALFDCLKTLKAKIIDWHIAHIRLQVEQKVDYGWTILVK